MKFKSFVQSVILLSMLGIQMSVMAASVERLSVDKLLEQARAHAEANHLKEAMALYKEILILEKDHHTARKELSSLLMNAYLNEPYSEDIL